MQYNIYIFWQITKVVVLITLQDKIKKISILHINIIKLNFRPQNFFSLTLILFYLAQQIVSPA